MDTLNTVLIVALFIAVIPIIGLIAYAYFVTGEGFASTPRDTTDYWGIYSKQAPTFTPDGYLINTEYYLQED